MKSRSMGVKLIVVCGLALLMTIPAFFVGALVEDRTQRAADVIREISSHVGGQQTFLGPTLVIPYNIPPQSPAEHAKHGMYLVFPARASATIKTATEERRRSLFKVPVFQADLKLDAAFDLTGSCRLGHRPLQATELETIARLDRVLAGFVGTTWSRSAKTNPRSIWLTIRTMAEENTRLGKRPRFLPL
jgi:inner membrane protein involved in colicin E2 resistance